MTAPARLHRWDEIALEKITEMFSRKIVAGERQTLAQIYLKDRKSTRLNSSHT